MQSDSVVREALMEDLARLRTLCDMGKLMRRVGWGGYVVMWVFVGKGVEPGRIGRSVVGKWVMIGRWSESMSMSRGMLDWMEDRCMFVYLRSERER